MVTTRSVELLFFHIHSNKLPWISAPAQHLKYRTVLYAQVITHAAHGLYLFTYRSGVEKLTVKPIFVCTDAYLKQVEEEENWAELQVKLLADSFPTQRERMDQSMHNANRGSLHSVTNSDYLDGLCPINTADATRIR